MIESDRDDQLRTRGLKALGWEFTGKAISQGTVFIVSLVLARLLSPTDFGLIAIIMVTVAIGQILSDSGLATALIQRERLSPKHPSSAFYFNALAGLILTFVVFGLAGQIGEVFESPELANPTRAISILFLINALNIVQQAQLRKELNYGLLARIEILSAVIGGSIGIVAALFGVGLWSLVLQMLSMGTARTVFTWIFSTWRPTGKLSLPALRQLWSYGSPMFASQLLDVIFTRLDFLIIGKLFSPATLGYFERAKTTNQVLVENVSITLMSVLFPIFSQIQGDLARTRNVTITSLRVLCFPVFLITGSLFLTSSEFIVLLFGEHWKDAAVFFGILVISRAGYPINALLMNVMAGRGRSRTFLRLEVVKKIFLLCNLLVLIFWGINAYLYGLIVQSTLAVALGVFAVSQEINLPVSDFFKPIFTQCSIAILGAVIVTLLRDFLILNSELISLLFNVTLFVAIYIATSAIFRTKAYEALGEQVGPELLKLKAYLGNSK